MIHSSYYKPRIFPYNGDVAPSEIDRAQSIDVSPTLNRSKIEEIGRDGVVGYVKQSSSVSYRISQLEYGSLEFFRKITNKADSVETITLADFRTSAYDICAYLTDDDSTFVGTVWYPKLRTSGFSVTAGAPSETMERGFDAVGENAIIWQGDNKYVIYERHEAGSGADTDIDLSTRPPAVDPDAPAGDNSDYFIRVLRVRGTATSELTYTTDYTYNPLTKVLSVVSIQAADVIKVYYTSATAPATLFTNNDSDAPALTADSVDIYLYIPGSGKPSSSDYLYRLQSASLEVAFDREDLKEIGNKEVVQRGITDSTVTATLGRIIEDHTVEEVLRGEVADYGKLDIDQFTDSAALIIKVYSDSTKQTFLYGLKATGLSPTDLTEGAAVNSYVNKDATLEGEDLTITTNEVTLGI